MTWLSKLLERRQYPLVTVWPEVDAPEANQIDRAFLVKHMHSKNPVRWARFVKDYRFFQKQMKKLNRNPEDVRFLLP